MFEGIVEIEEAGKNRANQLLAAGFRLLGVNSVSWEAKRRTVGPGQSESYIRHDFRYVIGRSFDQAEFPPREWPATHEHETRSDAPVALTTPTEATA